MIQYQKWILVFVLLAAIPLLMPACGASMTSSSDKTTPKTPDSPKELNDPCTLKPPGKECTSIFDSITAGCKRRDEINTELQNLASEKTKSMDEQTSIKNKIALFEKQAGPANRTGPLLEELKELQKKLDKIDADTRALESERQELELKLQDYVKAMKECEKKNLHK
jgi:hypothetical protein